MKLTSSLSNELISSISNSVHTTPNRLQYNYNGEKRVFDDQISTSPNNGFHNTNSPIKNLTKLNDGDNLINMLMRLQEVTMSNQKKPISSNRLINETNLALTSNMIITMPKSVESTL